MLLREVLSDTYQPSFVEAADQQEHCSFKKRFLAEVWGKLSMLNRFIRWNKFRQMFISYTLQPANARSTSTQMKGFRLLQFIAIEAFYPAYEMEQISADFHLISRLSGSHINCHSYKSH
jgi:hypothetical protein